MRGRYLKENKSCKAPSAHISFDTETLAEPSGIPGVVNHRLRLMVAIYWRREAGKIKARQVLRTKDSSEFWEWVKARLSAHRTTWVWAHNAGFDLSISDFFKQVEAGEFVAKFKAVGGEVTIITGYFGKCKVVFADTYNWFRHKLQTLGDWVGAAKLPISFEKATDEELFAYCERDCEIVESVVNRLCDSIHSLDLGCMRFTISGQSYQHWRHLEGRPPILIPNNIGESRLARRCYYGGRTELFRRGMVAGPIYALDVNGMYGACMLSDQLPTKMVGYERHADMDCLRHAIDVPCMSATVKIRTDHPYPYRVRGIGTVWAIGEYWADLCGSELTQALQEGVVLECQECALYELADSCRAFSQYWYKKRLEFRAAGDAIMERVCKDMPCALYGKLAQRAIVWESVGRVGTERRWGQMRWYDEDKQEMYDGRLWNGEIEINRSRVWRPRRDGKGSYLVEDLDPSISQETETSFPAIAGWITAIGRQMMDRYRLEAGAGNVYYQCGDCIHVSEEGYQRLLAAGTIDPERQGALKVSGVHECVEYWGINLLRIDGSIKAAGLPGIHTQFDSGEIQATTFERLDAILRRGPDGSVRVATKEWRPDMQYRHSNVREDGWCEPIHVDATGHPQ